MAQARRPQMRVNGRFVSDPDRPPKKPSPPRQNQHLASLRLMAMRLARHLKTMLPPEEKAPEEKAPEEKAPKAKVKREAAEAEAAARAAKAADPALAALYDRLVGKGAGIVDAFATLAQVVVRIVDQERQAVAPPDSRSNPSTDTQTSEQALGHRITVELDRLAARRRAQGLPGPNDPH